MSAQRHTGAARRTPYEVVFGDEVFENEHFPAIAREIDARGADAADPGAFVMLASVGALLRALRPAEEDAGAPSPDAVLRYGALAYQAFHFHVAGHPLFTLEDELLDELVQLPVVGAWMFRPLEAAGYVQLPRHRVWVDAEGGGAPEPVDGFFWTTGTPERRTRLDVLLCTGVRPGRPGIGAIDLAAPLPPEPGHWGDLDARGTGPDFANILPGGELEGLYALTNAAEALKLVSRIFWYAATRPASLGEPITAPPDSPSESPHALPPSGFAARPIRRAGKGDQSR